MKRRQFIQVGTYVLGVGLLSGCGITLPARSTSSSIPRIGVLASGSPESATSTVRHAALKAGLEELGYVDGKTIAMEYRWGQGSVDRLPALAAELAQIPVNVIVAGGGSTPARASKDATSTTPIVMTFVSDPVGDGLINSLARPGGNVTGLTSASADLTGKRLELLKAAIPTARQVVLLLDPNAERAERAIQDAEEPARRLGMQVRVAQAATANDLDATMSAAVRDGAEVMIVRAGGFLNNRIAQVVELAAIHRIPTMYTEVDYVVPGGLMAYAPNAENNYRRAATYVDKILKGANPADLPVEQPTAFDFSINLKSAQALGITIPQSVLAQATEVIQ